MLILSRVEEVVMVTGQNGDSMAGIEREAGKNSRDAARVFHEHAVEYDSWFRDSLVFAIELSALQSLHTKIIGPGMEIGVGPGRFAGELGLQFGLDPAWNPLVLASRRGIQCCQGTGEQLPVKDKSLGAIYLLFTLCFVADPEKVLAECCRCLRDDGHLVVGMIPAGSTWGRSLIAKKKAGHHFYRHARFYTVEDLMLWLASAGMEIREHRSTLYQSPGALKNSEAPRDALDKGAGFVVVVAGKKHE